MSHWNKKREVIRKYDATAGIYNFRYAEEQTAKYLAALENIRKEKLGFTLDAGCGTGLLFDHIKDRADMIIGLDISRSTLLKAKERVGNIARAHLIRADIDVMPLKPNLFDHVFVVTVIQNVPRPDRTLSEIKRVARLNAVIVVTALKKLIPRRFFEKLLLDSGLEKVAFYDRNNLKCYVAICAKKHH